MTKHQELMLENARDRILKLEKCCGELIHDRDRAKQRVGELEDDTARLEHRLKEVTENHNKALTRAFDRIDELEAKAAGIKPVITIYHPPGVAIKVTEESRG